MRSHVFVTALFLACVRTEALATDGPLVEECRGCHGPERDRPVARFANGLGRWKDGQCFGCHAELNDIGVKLASGVRDARYFAAPMAEDKLSRLSRQPLSFTRAPLLLDPGSGSVRRLSRARLERFLRRPSATFAADAIAAPGMMAFPRISPDALAEVWGWVEQMRDRDARPGVEVDALRAEDDRKMSPTEYRAAQKLFDQRCAPCHGGARPTSGRTGVTLSLFSAEWLEWYSSGRGRTEGDGRKMPDVELSSEEARALYRFFGAMRAEAERKVDRATRALDAPRALRDDRGAAKVEPELVSYIFGRFFTDAGCVHCHLASPRAAQRFVSTPEGLRRYLETRSGSELWRRLELRAIEAEHGLGTKDPGMPMGRPPLPPPLRAAVGRWVRASCPDPEGRTLCKS